MAAEFPLKLTIEAVDKATASLRAINKRMAAFTAPVRKLNNSFRALADEAGVPRLLKSFSGVGSAVRNVGQEAVGLGLKLAGMAAGAGVALFAIVKGAVDAGDKLGEMAQRVGLGVDTYAQLQFAAAQADVEQEAFNKSMDVLNRNLGKMKAGGGEMIAFLEKVNPKFAAQMKGARNMDEALALLTAGFERISDPAKRAALASAAFGEGGAQIGEWLHQGNKAIDEQKARFLDLAGSQEEFVRGAGDMDNALRESEVAALGLRNAAAGALFPALTELTRGVTGFLVANRDGIAKWASETAQRIKEWVEGGGLDRLKEKLESIIDTVRGAIGMLGGLRDIFAAVAAIMTGKLLLSVLMAAKSLGLLSGVLATTPIGWFLAGIAAIAGAAFLLIKYWEPIKKFFVDLWDIIKSVVSAIPDAILTDSGKAAYGVSTASSQPVLGAQAVASQAVASHGSTEARVQVDFANMPRGARVTADRSSTTPLDLSVGYSMLSSH